MDGGVASLRYMRLDSHQAICVASPHLAQEHGAPLYRPQHRAASQGAASAWAPLLASLPERVETPLLWSDVQRAELLRGSPVAEQSRARGGELRSEWAAVSAAAPDLAPGARCISGATTLSLCSMPSCSSCPSVPPLCGDASPLRRVRSCYVGGVPCIGMRRQ